VGVLINLLELVQLLTNINPIFLGMTCLAWANCIGDYISITTFAKRGRAGTAVAGVFSGQLFNFLIGFGASLLIQSSEGEYAFDIFSFKGNTFEVLSDSIALLVIVAGLIHFSLIFYTVMKKR
jgi:Ca2+/Na+ antiporter